MADARFDHEWDMAAGQMALVAEIHRDREKRRQPFTPEDFHPSRAAEVKREPDMIKITADEMRQLLRL